MDLEDWSGGVVERREEKGERRKGEGRKRGEGTYTWMGV